MESIHAPASPPPITGPHTPPPDTTVAPGNTVEAATGPDALRPDFSDCYAGSRADRYHAHHRKSPLKRLANGRELAAARRALRMAGNPDSVLDLPCGTGRFWPVLCEREGRKLTAMDASSAMIETAFRRLPDAITERVDASRGNAFDIRMPDGAVDTVFSMRFLHHLKEREDRLALLGEFRRVARSTVVISVWVDGNFQAFSRRLRKKNSRGRYLIPREVLEREFIESGFAIEGHQDLLKFCSMWRVYVLRKLPESGNRLPA